MCVCVCACLILSFSAVSVCVSSWTLVTMSVERYYAICQPFRSKSERQTWSHVYKVIGAVWALSLLLMLPIAMLSELQPTREPSMCDLGEEGGEKSVVFVTSFDLI